MKFSHTNESICSWFPRMSRDFHLYAFSVFHMSFGHSNKRSSRLKIIYTNIIPQLENLDKAFVVKMFYTLCKTVSMHLHNVSTIIYAPSSECLFETFFLKDSQVCDHMISRHINVLERHENFVIVISHPCIVK